MLAACSAAACDSDCAVGGLAGRAIDVDGRAGNIINGPGEPIMLLFRAVASCTKLAAILAGHGPAEVTRFHRGEHHECFRERVTIASRVWFVRR